MKGKSREVASKELQDSGVTGDSLAAILPHKVGVLEVVPVTRDSLTSTQGGYLVSLNEVLERVCCLYFYIKYSMSLSSFPE